MFLIFALSIIFSACNESKFERGEKREVTIEESDVIQSDLVEIGSCGEDPNINLNIQVVLDNSGSQSSTDPKKIRVEAAKDFISQLSGRSVISKQKIGLHVSAFNDIWYSGGNWSDLVPESLDNIRLRVDQLTKTPGGRTQYSQAFLGVQKTFSEKGVNLSDPINRNFVVFLTDGIPTEANFLPIVENVVSEFKAGIFAIASGESLTFGGVAEKEAEAIVKSLALPVDAHEESGVKGKYIRVKDLQTELGDAFTEILNDIVSPKCQSSGLGLAGGA